MYPTFQHVGRGSDQDISDISREYQRVGRPISYSASWVNWLVSFARVCFDLHSLLTLWMNVISHL